MTKYENYYFQQNEMKVQPLMTPIGLSLIHFLLIPKRSFFAQLIEHQTQKVFGKIISTQYLLHGMCRQHL